MYACTGDERFKTRADILVAELAKVQDALAAEASTRAISPRSPRSSSIASRRAQRGLGAVLHAAQDHGRPARREPALRQPAGARHGRSASPDWVKFRVDRLTDAQQQAMLETEFGGMNEVLANLYARSPAKPSTCALARGSTTTASSIRSRAGDDPLDGLHANTQIPKIIGAAREYELTGETRYRDIARRSSGTASRRTRSYANGGNSDDEHFFPDRASSPNTSAPSRPRPATPTTCSS